MAATELFIGLMSGTSMDGVDAALIEISDVGLQTLASYYQPYPEDIRRDAAGLLDAGSDDLHRSAVLGNQLARLYANAVSGVLGKADVSPEAIRAIGCHGQTLRHRPDLGYTIQINNPALLAELSGICVIADFRSRDVAAGGQGAPLVPAVHDALFRSPTLHRVILNLGGIANLTNLAPGSGTAGFDCGPANVLLDAWAAEHLGQPFDQAGQWAKTGKLLPGLLDQLMEHPFFCAVPPKSCGHEQFNIAWVKEHLAGTETPADVQATLVALTAGSVARAIQRWCGTPAELYVCGGGAHNDALMGVLKETIPNVKMASTDALGISADWVEAVAFAWLAHRCLQNLPGNLPAVTGARGPRILGAIYPA